MSYKTHRQKVPAMLTTESNLALQIIEIKNGKGADIVCRKGHYTAVIRDDNRNIIDWVGLETRGQYKKRTGKNWDYSLYADCPNWPEYAELTKSRNW